VLISKIIFKKKDFFNAFASGKYFEKYHPPYFPKNTKTMVAFLTENNFSFSFSVFFYHCFIF
jgi:hypothetical protein